MRAIYRGFWLAVFGPFYFLPRAFSLIAHAYSTHKGDDS